MGAGELWFGVVGAAGGHFQWVPQPDLPVPARGVGYYDEMSFENGGAAAVRSHGSHREFTFNVEVDQGLDWLDMYTDFAAGYYGSGLMHFADPFHFLSNVLPPSWSAPGLAELGWPSPVAGDGVFSSTTINYKQPARVGTWNVTTAANATPTTDETIPYVIIPIPPGYELRLGCSGTATGTAVVRVEPWVNDSTIPATASSLTLLSPSGSTRMNATVADTYAFVRVFITRTSSAASTITPRSMTAQLWKTGVSGSLTGDHRQGRGHTGLKFADDAIAEDYRLLTGGVPFRSLSTRLVEVGAWM